MTAARLRNTGRFLRPADGGSAEHTISNLRELKQLMSPATRTPTPIRPAGARSACTGCNSTPSGTVINVDRLDKILNIDAYNYTVTAQAGVRIYRLAEALATHGLELVGAHDLAGRTLGGAIAAPSMGPGIGKRSACLSSRVLGAKLVSPAGELMKVNGTQKNLLGALRSSYGLLGVIVEATLRVQPIANFTVSHRKLPIDDFCRVVDTLSNNETMSASSSICCLTATVSISTCGAIRSRQAILTRPHGS